jgi:hypothetical protein
MRRVLPVLLTFLPVFAGCEKGPVPTPGAQGQPPERMALVRVTQHGGLHEWNGNAIHIDKFFVGGIGYPVAGDADQQPFLVTPGAHTFMVDYGRCVHGWAGRPDDDLFTGPFGRFEATVEGGAEYVLTAEGKLAGANAVQTLHTLRRVGGPTGSDTPATMPVAPTAGPTTAPATRP